MIMKQPRLNKQEVFGVILDLPSSTPDICIPNKEDSTFPVARKIHRKDLSLIDAFKIAYDGIEGTSVPLSISHDRGTGEDGGFAAATCVYDMDSFRKARTVESFDSFPTDHTSAGNSATVSDRSGSPEFGDDISTGSRLFSDVVLDTSTTPPQDNSARKK